MSKPRPGVCGTCGCAVVHNATPIEEGTTCGHTYERWRLKKVRCPSHDDIAKALESEMEKIYGSNWRERAPRPWNASWKRYPSDL